MDTPPLSLAPRLNNDDDTGFIGVQRWRWPLIAVAVVDNRDHDRETLCLGTLTWVRPNIDGFATKRVPLRDDTVFAFLQLM
jgi:hypothetical protein